MVGPFIFVDEFGPARLALENSRLAAEAAVRAEELTESAGRLVARAEQSRRSIERDLHDGAQRHVLNLGMAIQADRALPELVRKQAAVTVRSVLDQLRTASAHRSWERVVSHMSWRVLPTGVQCRWTQGSSPGTSTRTMLTPRTAWWRRPCARPRDQSPSR